ncbi:MAG TPA: ATP-binding protein, partial [Ktedonobacterales bacterium]|nr:ATP-binding protein [Ktedonobacterales bacterium]
ALPSVTADDLRALEARYRALVLATGQITWTSRPEGNGGWAGDGRDWCLFTGQDTAAAAGRGWLDALHPDDRERAAVAWNAAVATTSSYEIDYRVRRHDGEYRWLLVRGVLVPEVDGSAREWVGTATDITERRQTANQRAAAEEALRESEARLAAELADTQVLQTISTQLIQEGNLEALYEQILNAAIAVTHADMGSMQMLYPDRGALRLLAWKGFDPASAAFWEWVRVGEGCSCGEALRTGERVIVHDVETCDFMAGTEDLDSYHRSGIMAVQSTPLLARDGSLVGMISTHWRTPHQPSERELRLFDVLARQAADLIERKQAEDALRLANVRMDEFLNMATHELKTPLTALQANLQLAERRLQLRLAALEGAVRKADGTSAGAGASAGSETTMPAQRALQGIAQLLIRNERQVRQLTRLVDDLVDAARIETGKLEIRPAPCDLAVIMREAVAEQRTVHPKRAIHLQLPQQQSVPVNADAGRISQAVANYLTNALKYAPDDRPVEVVLRVEGDTAYVSVRDDGSGIPAEDQAHVWERGFRAAGVRSSSEGVGLGLGLHISRTIVERHGGTVGVESAPGKGSTFWFTLPLAPGDLTP